MEDGFFNFRKIQTQKSKVWTELHFNSRVLLQKKKTESQQPGINIGHKRTILFSNQKRILVDPSFVASTATVG